MGLAENRRQFVAVTRIEGELREGAKLSALLDPPDGRAMRFTATVTALRPERELRWLGLPLLPRLFDGEHIFELDPVGDGPTRLVNHEEFRGVLVAPLLLRIGRKTLRRFGAMNEALRGEPPELGARPGRWHR